MFVHLYESILGEKVPDLITIPSCQEDDAHNVQAVIDSLALDYLQVSLSHITGENIVKGEKESIRNLLEIFDGLLEYLTEEINETASHSDDDLNQMAKDEDKNSCLEEQEDGLDASVPSLKLSSAVGSSLSSEIVPPSWKGDGSESTSELIKLGDTAYLFSLRNEELSVEEILRRTTEHEELNKPSSHRGAIGIELEGAAKTSELPREQLSSNAKKLGEPIRPAIPLQPPYQPSAARALYPAEKDNESSGRSSVVTNDVPTKPQGLGSNVEEPLEQKSETPSGGIHSLSKVTSDLPTGADEPESKTGGTDEPVLEDTLDGAETEVEENVQYEAAPSSAEDRLPRCRSAQSTRPKQRNLLHRKSKHESSITDSLAEEPLSHRWAKEELSNQKLYNMSEKLSRRLNELDAMLKQALGERSREESSSEDDKLSQHSDSVMDYRQMKPESAAPLPRGSPSRRRSLSASPPPSSRQLSTELHDALWKDARGPVGEIRDRLQNEEEQRKLRAKLLSKAYDNELRAYEASERFELAKIRARAKETERKYKANFFKEPPRASLPVKVYSRKNAPRNPKLSQWISSRGVAQPKKVAPMKVKENDLLPQLLDEFPHLHISHPTMNKMWRQQLAQIDQLRAPNDRTRLKLQSEVLEALKKHDLLVEIIKKEQAHNKRLQEFKQRIIRQKCAQNKMRERRQQIARAKKYYQDYRVQLRAKMMKARTREERIFKNLFEDALEIQKQRLHELKVYAKDKRAEQRRQHQIELESMENYYKDQFSMLAEAVSEERREIQSRERTHTKTLNKVKRELRSKMEKEIQELQNLITQADDDSFFREIEADRLKSRLQMASFQYSKNYHFL
ncbi:centrosomal protein of 95 kDa isoform X2 [Tiliqua scincoides]